VGLDRPDEAEISFRRALELDPNDPENHLELAMALKGQGRYDEAVEHVRRAIELRPDDPNLYRQFGILLTMPEPSAEADEPEADARRGEAEAPKAELDRRVKEGARLEIVGWQYLAWVAVASAVGVLSALIGIASAPLDGRFLSWIFVPALVLSLIGLTAAGGLYFERRRQLHWVRSLLDAMEASPAASVSEWRGDEQLAGAVYEMADHLERAGALEESRRLGSVGALRGFGRRDVSSAATGHG
jgi:hypothetical protein